MCVCVRALTQDIKGGQYVKLHPFVEMGVHERKAEGSGLLPLQTPDLKLHFKDFFSLTGFQLPLNFPDERSSIVKLVLKTPEVVKKDHKIGI